ncbi:RagB/SusD family nutrient uptake outer membrane protein [Echinicola salinicaeni]|uniref:RagB/SusD family nutrient uptake outer membrane protein n=1 Tax=Echinicola salinicaeni TaxID=2762757 RepID=UPI0016451BB7|nr:RagB/SusD family nutrient uptake outer membrane protein [Echinicola salinicaeni]
MKKINYIFLLLFSLGLVSCNEDEILNEVPLDFYSPENSFTKPEHIESSMAYLYARVRNLWDGNVNQSDVYYGTDLASGFQNTLGYADYQNEVVPTAGRPNSRWSNLYRIIFDANVIISRIEGVDYPDEASKNAHIAEAMFFRAYAYNCLANFFGGVPLVLEEVTSPKRDFVRESREAVYQQCAIDLEFAAANLPDINNVKGDGRASKAAANHLLSEIYISLKEYNKAVQAASAVIENPNFALMTSRFGSSADEMPGDAYFDLFEPNNQNRSSGNTEAILVLQVEFNIPGGGGSNVNWGTGYKFERYIAPLYWQLKDPDGVAGFIGPTTKNGGRGIGWVRGTDHFTHEIWKGDWDNDIRNAEHNMERDYTFDNPASAYFGQSVQEVFNAGIEGYPTEYDTMRLVYAYPTKLTTHNKHPEEIMIDVERGILSGNSGITYLDFYLMRLAETYLLRAEAYLGLGDLDKAAADINKVRERANATPVVPSDVDIDYILDERLRELSYEEPRRLTLSRLGKLVERTQKYGRWSDESIQPHNELYPIPYSEIERNTEAVLEQNPGYVN